MFFYFFVRSHPINFFLLDKSSEEEDFNFVNGSFLVEDLQGVVLKNSLFNYYSGSLSFFESNKYFGNNS